MTKQIVERDTDGFPLGWVLQRPSYGFHRSFYGTVGRPALVGEYSRFSRQVWLREAVPIGDDAWLVATDSGEKFVVLIHRGKWHVNPTLVLPADWRPTLPEAPIPETVETVETVAKTVETTETAPAAPAPGRLSLGSTVAAMALEARLRRAGIVATS
jgi:hypothetical protein